MRKFNAKMESFLASKKEAARLAEMPDSEKRVIIDGSVQFYKQKAPFVLSGESLYGALEYDPGVEKVKCHECGHWFRSLLTHVKGHGLTAKTYKERHGFDRKAALMCESMRNSRLAAGIRHAADVRMRFAPALVERIEKARQRREEGIKGRSRVGQVWSPEKKNLRGTCQAQLLERLNTLTRQLGHTPSMNELNKAGIWPYTLCAAFNVDTVYDVYSLLGMAPGYRCVKPKYSPELLIELLRDFYVKHERLPSRSDYFRGIIPSTNYYQVAFGSLENAYVQAGLGLVYAERLRAESNDANNGRHLEIVQSMINRSRGARIAHARGKEVPPPRRAPAKPLLAHGD